MNPLRIAITRPVFTTMLMAALVVLGLFSFRRLNIDEYPDVSIPVLTIQAVLPGAGPETVEREVTRPIEEAVNTVEGIDAVRSTSLESVGLIVAEFSLDTDSDAAAADVRAKLDELRRDLPADLEPPVIQKFDPSDQPIVSLALFSDDADVRELTAYAEDVIKPRLEAVRGVASVDVVGGLRRQVQVNLRPERLEALGVGVTDVVSALQRENLELPAGRLSRGNVERIVRVEGRFAEPSGFGDVILGVRDGTPILLRDAADVVDGMEEARSLALVNGRRAVALDVRKVQGSNTVEAAEAVTGTVAELAADLPGDYRLDVVQDNSTFIRNAVKDVNLALVVGALLTVLIVFLFLADGRATAITALSLPVSLISAFIVFDALGFTLNTMTLLGLSLSVGILVDNAIVVIENIVRHRQQGATPEAAAEAGTREIALPATAATLAIVAVFVPVAFMGGVVGKFFYQFGITVAWAVTISLLVSFTLTPMLAAWWTGAPGSERPKRRLTAATGRALDAAMTWSGAAYRRAIAWSLDRRRTTLAIAGGSLLAAAALFPVVGGEFMPGFDRGEFHVHFRTPTGSTLEYTRAKADQVEAVLQELPGVRHTYTRIGAGLGGTVELGETLVMLEGRRRRPLDQWALMERAREDLALIHGVEASVLPKGRMGVVAKPLEVEIRGPDLAELERIAGDVAVAMATTPGVIEVETSLSGARPELTLEVRRGLAAELGLGVASVAGSVRAALAGETATTWDAPDGSRYDVLVQLPADRRTDIEDVARLPVASGRPDPVTGGRVLVPLEQIATLEAGTGPSAIDRLDLQRLVTVSANVAGDADLRRASAAVRASLSEIELPAGYTAELGGETADFEETAGYVLEALLLAILLIYMILASQLGSFVTPLAIMASLPLAVVGAVGALFLTGDTLNIMSMIGVILLMGLVTKSAILLVEFATELRARGRSRRDALIEAGGIRLRPILMTALATIFGMLPIALALGEGAEFRAPMARAVIGGMITATLLTLIVVPVIYTFVDDLGAWARRRAGSLPNAGLSDAAEPAAGRLPGAAPSA